jgi:hypothetical protein
MTMLHLPHKVADYACPINGLEDMYEWKTGRRLPGYFLMDLSMTGFLYIKQKNAPAPRIVFWGSGTGKQQHELLGDIMGYRWTFSEDTAFSSAWKQACARIDQGRPVILGLLDMYHLPFYPKMYHRMHIPQHYVLLVGYDAEKQVAFVQDNGLKDVQTISLTDLREAWNVNNPGQGKKNTYCIVEFGERVATLEEIARLGLKKKASQILNPPVGFMGISGMRRLAADISNWEKELTPVQLKKCLSDLVTFTCSVVPMPPKRLLPYPMPHVDPHQGTRDRLSAALVEHGAQFHEPAWVEAAAELAESGRLIGQITDLIVDGLIGSDCDLRQAGEIINRIADREEKAYRLML